MNRKLRRKYESIALAFIMVLSLVCGQIPIGAIAFAADPANANTETNTVTNQNENTTIVDQSGNTQASNAQSGTANTGKVENGATTNEAPAADPAKVDEPAKVEQPAAKEPAKVEEPAKVDEPAAGKKAGGDSGNGGDNASATTTPTKKSSDTEEPKASLRNQTPTHAFSVYNQDTRGTVTIVGVDDPNNIAEGTSFFVQVEPKANWKIKTIKFREIISYSNIQPLDVVDTTAGYMVTMPEHNADVSIEYEPAEGSQLYQLSFDTGGNTHIYGGANYYSYERPEGDHVVLQPGADSTYLITSVTAKNDTTGADIELSGPYNTEFDMPASNVTVYLAGEPTTRNDMGLGHVGNGSIKATFSDGWGNDHTSTGGNSTALVGWDVELVATPNEGNHFVGWFPGTWGDSGFIEDYSGSALSTDPNWSYKITEDSPSAICAVFAEESPAAMSTIWISDTDGIMNNGGGIKVSYTTEEGTPNTDADTVRYSSTQIISQSGTEVTVTAVPDSGYELDGWYRADLDAAAGAPHYKGDAVSTESTFTYIDNPMGLGDPSPYVVAVFKESTTPAHQGDQVQMWVGNIDGQTAMNESGGKVAVQYTPSWDDYPDSIIARAGTDFVYGDILQFYKGDECTVYAQADDGYEFVGWYHVDAEWPKNDNKSYMGTVISTEPSFTYKPGETVVAGDTEALRYVCAVFEADSAETATCTISCGEGGTFNVSYTDSTGSPNTLTGVQSAEFSAKEDTQVTLTEIPDANHTINGWYVVIGTTGLAFGPQGDSDETGVYTFTAGSAPSKYVGFFAPVKHTVSFNTHGADTATPDVQQVDDGGHATKPANPQKENLHFLGWFEKEPSKLTKADITGSNWGGFNFTNTAITDDLTLHAAWYADFNGNSYDITDPDNPVRSVSYSNKGGSIIWTSSYQSPSSPTTQWYSYSTIQESEVTITANPFEGYEFVCWALNAKPSADDILSTSATYTFTFDGEMTIYGLFQKATHTVSFDTGEGDAVQPQTVAHGGYATAPTDVKWNNYNTMGWHTAANPDTAFNFSETPIMGDVVLYPNWVLSTSAHAMKKDANYSMGGGTVKRTSESLVPAMPGGPGTTALTLSAPGSTVSFEAEAADGFEFVGWTAGTSPTGTILSTEKTFSFTAESTSPNQLFALFQEKTTPTLTVVCSINGGNISEAYSSVTVNGEALTMSEPDDGLLRPDPTVQGKVDIAPGEDVTVVITPTANYTVFGYSFTNISDYTGNMSPDGTATITFEMPEENAGVSASLTHAVNVEYDANGGTPNLANWPADNIVKLPMGFAAIGIPISANNFAEMVTPPTGLTFAGLEVTHDGGTTTVNPDDTLSSAKFTQGGKIKWLWSGGKTVHFDANGGDGTMDDVTVAEGAEYELPKCGFMAPSEDKAFDKWQVGDQYYSPGDTITVSDDVTVVATWKDAVNIIIIAFGPDDSLKSLTVNGQPKAHGTVVLEPGADIEIVAAPKTGYAVSGTNMTTNLGATSAYDPTTGNITVSAEDVAAGAYIVMFAISTSVTVHFDAAGGTPAPDDQILPQGRKAIEPVGDFAPVKDGWNLLWWYDANDTEKSEFDFDTAIQEDTTLKAAWNKDVLVKVYDKTLKVNGEGGYYLAGNDATHYIAGNHQVLEGDSATFTAYPAEEASLFTTGPRMFLGWCEIDTTSPEEHITSQNATYTINNYNGAPEYLTAVFAEAVNVAFDANGGSPTPETQTIEKGTKAQAPETVTKENLSLLGWFEGTDFTAEPVDFATQTFSSHTTLTAGWYGQFTATAYDKYAGKAEQGGTIALSGGSSGVLISISRLEGAEITLTATPSDNYRFVGWAEGSPTAEVTITEQTHTWTYDGSVKQIYAVFVPTATVAFDANDGTTGDAWKTSETVDAGTNLSELLGNTVPENPPSDVVTAPAGKIFNGYSVKTADMDNPKNFFVGNEIDFELTESATVKYLWRDPILTIRWSSIDGNDLMDAWYCRNVAAGTTVGEALSSTFNKALSDKDYFEKDGYEDWGYRTPKPMSAYSDYSAMYADEVQATDVVEADMDIYVDMIKQIDEVSLTLEETPVCGSEVTTDKVDDQWSWATQTPVPNVTLADGVPYVFDTVYGTDVPWCFWTSGGETWAPFVGTFKGGETYPLEVWLKANFGYTFADNVAADFDGTSNTEIDYDGGYIGVTAKATATHIPGDAKHENELDPTCTEDGSYDNVVRCTKCDEILSTEYVKLDKLGHDWSEWSVVKKPTETEEGLEKRTCSRGDAEETRPIDKLDFYYYIASGDGSTWTKGSNQKLRFSFKRSLSDNTTYDHFESLFVDGKQVPSNSYTAGPGSVIIDLDPAYLETLKVGEHKITAAFNDDKSADGTFTVKAAEKEKEKASDKDKTDKKRSSKDILSKTGDNMALGFMLSIILAAMAAIIGIFAWRRSRR